MYASIRPLYARAHSKARLLGLSGVEAVIGVWVEAPPTDGPINHAEVVG